MEFLSPYLYLIAMAIMGMGDINQFRQSQASFDMQIRAEESFPGPDLSWLMQFWKCPSWLQRPQHSALMYITFVLLSDGPNAFSMLTFHGVMLWSQMLSGHQMRLIRSGQDSAPSKRVDVFLREVRCFSIHGHEEHSFSSSEEILMLSQ